MLFQSDYWLASNSSEKSETIEQFLSTDDGIRTLVVIGTSGFDDVAKILKSIKEDARLPCNVALIKGIQIQRYAFDIEGDGYDNQDYTKTIHVFNGLNKDAIVALKYLMPILAIFVDV